eukprot:366287-Chlamydomonas_euryale.AAC.3
MLQLCREPGSHVSVDGGGVGMGLVWGWYGVARLPPTKGQAALVLWPGWPAAVQGEDTTDSPGV